jgi:hypothetical protein
METMGDLLERVKEFASHSLTKEEAEKVFGWGVRDLLARPADEERMPVIIVFDNGLILDAAYFLIPNPTDPGDICEIGLRLRTDLTARIRYKVFYSGYIHGQGYIRIDLGQLENKMAQKIMEEFYIPALKRIYKPIIIQFKGFYSRDHFGLEVDGRQGYIYYSPVRSGSESREARIWDVIARLHQLDALLREPEIRHSLAELDVQITFLPSVMWM